MANSEVTNEGLKDLLKPFYQRAFEAQDRLAKLEAAIPSNKGNSEVGNGNEECSKKVKELELKLEEVIAELASEKEKVSKLTVENGKHVYRVHHLVQSLQEADRKLEQLTTK